MAGRNGAPQPNLGSCLPVSVACLSCLFILFSRSAPSPCRLPIFPLFISRSEKHPRVSVRLSIGDCFPRYQIGDVSTGSFTGNGVSPVFDVDKIVELKKICYKFGISC